MWKNITEADSSRVMLKQREDQLTDDTELNLLKLRFDREKDEVSEESTPIVLDFDIIGGPGEIGRRRRFVGAGCMFYMSYVSTYPKFMCYPGN
jgi:hypothetical protein